MSLGSRIKKLRQINKLSVRELAQKVGLSASFVYQLEQEKVSPSFSTLKTIAQTLNTSITLLIEDDLPEEWVIVRKTGRKTLVTENEGLDLQLLTFLGTREKNMQPMIFELEPQAECSGKYSTHESEDFIFLLSGEIEVTVGNKKYILREGDAAYFVFDTPGIIKNIGAEKAKGLWIFSPSY